MYRQVTAAFATAAFATAGSPEVAGAGEGNRNLQLQPTIMRIASFAIERVEFSDAPGTSENQTALDYDYLYKDHTSTHVTVNSAGASSDLPDPRSAYLVTVGEYGRYAYPSDDVRPVREFTISKQDGIPTAQKCVKDPLVSTAANCVEAIAGRGISRFRLVYRPGSGKGADRVNESYRRGTSAAKVQYAVIGEQTLSELRHLPDKSRLFP